MTKRIVKKTSSRVAVDRGPFENGQSFDEFWSSVEKIIKSKDPRDVAMKKAAAQYLKQNRYV